MNIRKICPNCKRSPENPEAETCPHCRGYRSLILDIRGEEHYEVCTHCGFPRLPRNGNAAVACAGHDGRSPSFTWMNALEHRGLLKTFEPTIID